MFPQKSPFCPLFGPFYPILPSSRLFRALRASRYPPLKKRVATFALVTTVGPQPRPARSTPGEPGRAGNRQALASLSYPTDRQVLRNPPVGRPGFLVSMSIHPRTAVRRGRHAGLLSHTELPKSLRTIPTYIVYDNVTQCFGHELLSGAMRFSEKTNDRLHWLRTEGPGTFQLQGNVSGHCRLMGAQSLTCLEYFARRLIRSVRPDSARKRRDRRVLDLNLVAMRAPPGKGTGKVPIAAE